MQMQILFRALVVFATLVIAGPAFAQSFDGDARKVAMGGGGSDANIAVGMVAPAQGYAVIPIPLGLIQVLTNLEVFDPTGDEFDPAAASELGSNPMHFTFGRESGSASQPQARFMRDIVNGRLNRDLTSYSGFHLPTEMAAGGLLSSSFGKTIKFARKPSGAFQGFYIGAGPYLSFSTDASIDPRLSVLFATGTRLTNATLSVRDESEIQLAMSIVFGYRGRLDVPGWSGDRDGIYVAGNYRYLRGFKYLGPDMTVRFDTDNAGLLTLNPATTPIVIDNIDGDKGTGRAIDVGVQIVRDRWEGGVGINGIANKIDWTELAGKRFTLNSLITGGDFVEQTIANPGTLTVELPVVTSGNVAYGGEGYGFSAVVTRGFNGSSFHGGVEKVFGPLAVRGGARYSRDHWDPTWGVGFGRRVAVDVGFYGTHANLEEKQQISMAISIRIMPNQ